ncbi:MAG: rhomboid family intramembrane serine protease [Rhodobacteraceae bacterium]|nr:rhomboid family intramembrane serine protease [Paracoccaceae bacterium]
MTDTSRPARRHAGRGRSRRPSAAIAAIIVLCTIPEIVLTGADLGLWGSPGWRSVAVAWLGFWPGLLGNWRPNFPGQPWLMFATYGFLHAGLIHLTLNMLTLLSLGPPCAMRLGEGRFVALYAVSTVGGGLGYALLARGFVPMVGASGALFGLAGAILAWELRLRRLRRAAVWPVTRSVLILAGLNLLLWWAMDGLLAWQTHLGGFVAGWAAGLALDRRA